NSNSDTNKIMARMDAMTMKMDAQYKELQSEGSSNSNTDRIMARMDSMTLKMDALL
ncbi:hypothetical protein Tco_0154795, partial [Tanacetum coccineum]